MPKTLTYPKSTARNPIRAPTATETVLGAVGLKKAGAVGARALRELGGATKGFTAAELIRGAGGKVLGTAAVAGAVAYALAKFGLTQYALKQYTLRENAARAADAYRYARLKMADDQGYQLTKTQLKQLSVAFQNELLKLGLSSRDLSKLNQNFFTAYAPPGR